MRIIDAFWEKRNLGIDVSEVVVEENDTLDDLDSVLKDNKSSYCVLKINTGQIDLLWRAQELGFKLIETGIELEGRIDNLGLPAFYNRFESFLTVDEGDENIRERVMSLIRKGDIFSTDRIALDPYFSKKMAGERYYNWINDELERGSKLVIAYYKDEPIAFGVNKSLDEQTYDAFLGGMLPNVSNKGLGFAALYANYVSIKNQGGRKIVTRVSSNNSPILRLHIQYGYGITNMNYILVKHQ